MHCVLVGNFGVANLGDEALKEYFLRAFPEVKWTVVSAHPSLHQLPRLPAGIRSFFGTHWMQTVTTIRTADAVVFGGGTLWTDIESPLACVLWFLHARLAAFFGTPYFLAFQGFGPFRTFIGKKLARWVVCHAAFVSVRDEESARRAEGFAPSVRIVRTFDPVILDVHRHTEQHAPKKIILIPRAHSGAVFSHEARALASTYADASISIILMQPDDAREQRVAKRLQEELHERPVESIGVYALADLCHHLAGATVVLSQRYHGALIALALGVPTQIVSQAAGDKLSDLQQYAKNPALFPGLLERARLGELALRAALGI